MRLSRVGKKNKPMYRIIISEKARDPYGKALEILGSYNPHSKELQAKKDRIQYWISKGSGISPTLNNLLLDKKIIEGEKIKASKPGKKKKAEEEVKKPEVSSEETPAEQPTEQPAESPIEKPAESPAETPAPETK